ncbi:nuclear hormone receptor family member nhr-8 [Tetranychus urticae]|uniref:nuclear hormone receptor family member nhr-8 n=1 Tax=Tetranychus urticae TaxID=32264 RepID=UPI00077B8937|nr:nuclear hormone receptor family member nhr-8 [Tetranychus urticae]
MDFSDDFFDVWSAQWLDYVDCPESIDEWIGVSNLSSPELLQQPQLSSPSSSSVSPNSVENYPIDSTFPTSFPKSNGSNEGSSDGIKEFSDAIDAYFSSNYQSHDVNEPVPINNPNSIEYSSTSLTYYNSTTLNSSYISNLFGPLGSIDIGSFYSNYHAGMVPSSHRPLSLAKDCSKVQEPWIPSVAKKLLASYYSPLSMKSELLTNQVMLDAFESVALQEAVQAFKDIAFINPSCDSNLAEAIKQDFYSDPRPIELVYSCEKLRAYRKLNTEDKIHLMARAFFDINLVKAIVTYDETIDGWYSAGRIWPRTSVSWDSPNLAKVINLIETFPDFARNDINVVALLYLIVIFNPDLPKLKFRNGIRQEQYIYIYLLKRYLVSLFGSTCEASDYHYRLMVKIEQAIKIPETVFFEQIEPGSTKVLKNRVVKLVQYKSITMGNIGD